MPYRTIVIGVVLLSLVAVFVSIINYSPAQNELRVASLFTFEVVRTPEAQKQGLGGRTELPANYGMLFVFPEDAVYHFWMKDMLVSIDIVWLSANGEIVAIDEAVSPDTYPDSFYPPRPVRYVLETRSGEAVAQGFVVGKHIDLPI